MKKSFFLLLGIMVLLSACQEERKLDFIDNQGDILIVQALLTNEDKPHFVKLSESSSYYDVGGDFAAQGASVFINGVQLSEITSADSAGYYVTPVGFTAAIGETHTLEIQYQGSTYTAQGFMNPVPKIDSIRVKQNEIQPQFGPIEVGDTLFDVDVWHIEDQSRKDFYAFDVYYDGELLSESINDKFFVEDEFVLDGPVNYTAQNFFTRDIKTDKSYEVVLEMRSLTQEHFRFYLDFSNQTEGSTNPFFAPPPANISTNLSEGASGFFEVCAVSRDTVMFTPPGL